jgi:putative MATE family efflux protein
MSHRGSLTEGSIWLTLLRLSVPIMLSNFLQAAYQLIDAYWLGRFSQSAFAAVSLCFPINVLLISMAGGLPIAGAVLVAQFRGRREEQAVSHVTIQTLLMVLFASVVLTACFYPLTEPLIRWMGATGEVLLDAVSFLRVSLLGFVFVFGFLAYQSLLRGLGIVHLPMWIVALTVVLNFVLDPVLIFGWGPVPAMGVAGAALATVISQAIAVAIGLTLLFAGHHGVHLRLRDFRPDFAYMRKMFNLGWPASVEQATQALGFMTITKLAMSFGEAAVVAYGIGVRVILCVMIPAMGLCMATSTLVGQNIGAGRIDRAERTNWIACLMALVGMLTCGIVLYAAAEPLTIFFMEKGGDDAIQESVSFIRIVAFTFWCIGVQQVMFGTLRGAGNTVAPMVQAIVLLWLVRFPLAYVLSKFTTLGADGIWWAFTVSNVLNVVVTGLWFLRGDWKRRRLLDEVKLEGPVAEEAALETGPHF